MNINEWPILFSKKKKTIIKWLFYCNISLQVKIQNKSQIHQIHQSFVFRLSYHLSPYPLRNGAWGKDKNIYTLLGGEDISLEFKNKEKGKGPKERGGALQCCLCLLQTTEMQQDTRKVDSLHTWRHRCARRKNWPSESTLWEKRRMEVYLPILGKRKG